MDKKFINDLGEFNINNDSVNQENGSKNINN